MTSSKLLDLTKIINEGTTEIHNYLQSYKLPFPSHDLGAPATLPQALSKIQDTVLDATHELQELLTDPVTAVISYGNAQNLVTLNAIQRFDIANCFPPDQTTTFGQIAKQIGLNERFIKFMLRNAMTMKFFCEPEKGVVAHTFRSALLRQKVFRSLLNNGYETMVPGVLNMLDAVAKWPLLDEPSQTGFCLAHQTDQPVYKYVQQHPERAGWFADTMSLLTSGTGYEARHVVNGFPWSGEKLATVVDIGGSNGHMSIALAKAYPVLNFVVQDLEKTPTDTIKTLPENLSKRIKFMTHDFFKPQPVVADVYFLRWIFHNWPEKYCIRILRALIPALRPGACIYINEICMPEPGTVSRLNDRRAQRFALDMVSVFNGLERDAEEWRQLLEQADPRFRLRGIRQPEGSNLAMIEVVWQTVTE